MTVDSRERIIAGNWKMYKTSAEAVVFVQDLATLIKDAADTVYLATPFTSLEAAAAAARNTPIVVGAQNIHDMAEGAFTGEISAAMVKASGARFVILGHSERRQLFGETSALVNRKVFRALAEELRPLVCVGETLEQRDAEQTEAILAEQIHESLKGLSSEQFSHCIIAYEPVWAIGTGRTATPQQAQAAHRFIRGCIEKQWGRETANKVTILYGGSVKPSNAAILMSEADVDGLLVGSAALEVESFAQIVYHHSLVSGS
ncbi:MAG: triose-phosphate isomerase [Chlamydiales bacterium]|nr:triose-phosphate isomerase [Chlamydiales bacterium]